MSEDRKEAPIVILDESFPVRFRIREWLKAHQWESELAASYKEFRTPPPLSPESSDIFVTSASLFVVGLNLPDAKGLDVVQWLKESKRWRGVPIIMTAHNSCMSDVMAALQLGVSDFLIHPLEEKQFLTRITSLIGSPEEPLSETMPIISYNIVDVLSREVSRARRGNTAVSILLTSFSAQTTDSKGEHVRASAVAGRWGERLYGELQKTFRDIDTVANYGGGTYIAVLPLASKDDMPKLAERVRKATTPLAQKMGKETGKEVEASAGWATFPDDASDDKALLDIARKQLESSATSLCLKGDTSAEAA